MMRWVGSFVLQALLLLAGAVGGFFAGAFVPSLHLSRVVSQTATSVRTYDFDWIVAAVLVYALLLAVAALRRRLREGWLLTTAAFGMVVLVLALFTRIGFKDTPLF